MAARRSTTKPKRPTRAGIYVRISRDRATEVSTDVQRAECEAVCSARGLTVTDVYSDVGRSAFTRGTSRPALDRLHEDIAAGVVDVVVAYKLDRVSRSVADFAAFNAFCEEHGADIVLASQPIDTTGASGKLLRNVLAAFAEFESEIKSERIGGSMAHKARDGQPHPGGTRLFGYDTSRTALDRDEAKLIRAAAKKVLAGTSLAAVCRDWESRGITTPTGGPWRPQVLGRLLRNPFLAGLRDYEGARVVGKWPTVLDAETHEALVLHLGDPARRSSDTTKARHLLAGIAYCSLCGARLVSRPHRKHGTRYLCATGPGRPGCGKIAIKCTLADGVVAERVLDVLAASADDLRAAGSSASGIDAGKLERESTDIADRQRDLAAEWAHGKLSRAEWAAARDVLTERAEEIDRELRAAANGTSRLPDLPTDRDGLAALWAKADQDERRALVKLVVEKVVIHPGTRGKWTPDRVEVVVAE